MTSDLPSDLQAGKELDALIVRILGINPPKPAAYSTMDGPALELARYLVHLWSGKLQVTITITSDTVVCDIVNPGGNGRVAYQEAPTLPLAICRAFVQARQWRGR